LRAFGRPQRSQSESKQADYEALAQTRRESAMPRRQEELKEPGEPEGLESRKSQEEPMALEQQMSLEEPERQEMGVVWPREAPEELG
jgi:hypothetical protein